MYIRKFLQISFVFILFLGVQILLPVMAHAWLMCCGCGTSATCQYNSQCHCPGTAHCYWCAAPNPDPNLEVVHLVPSPNEPGFDVDSKGFSGSHLASYTQKVLSDIRGKNSREVLALKLFENVGGDWHFGCPAADDNYLQGNIAFALTD